MRRGRRRQLESALGCSPPGPLAPFWSDEEQLLEGRSDGFQEDRLPPSIQVSRKGVASSVAAAASRPARCLFIRRRQWRRRQHLGWTTSCPDHPTTVKSEGLSHPAAVGL